MALILKAWRIFFAGHRTKYFFMIYQHPFPPPTPKIKKRKKKENCWCLYVNMHKWLTVSRIYSRPMLIIMIGIFAMGKVFAQDLTNICIIHFKGVYINKYIPFRIVNWLLRYFSVSVGYYHFQRVLNIHQFFIISTSKWETTSKNL